MKPAAPAAASGGAVRCDRRVATSRAAATSAAATRRISGHGESRPPLLAMTKLVPKPIATIEPTTYPGILRIGACYPEPAGADAPSRPRKRQGCGSVKAAEASGVRKSGVEELTEEAQALGVLDGLAALVAVEV